MINGISNKAEDIAADGVKKGGMHSPLKKLFVQQESKTEVAQTDPPPEMELELEAEKETNPPVDSGPLMVALLSSILQELKLHNDIEMLKMKKEDILEQQQQKTFEEGEEHFEQHIRPFMYS